MGGTPGVVALRIRGAERAAPPGVRVGMGAACSVYPLHLSANYHQPNPVTGQKKTSSVTGLTFHTVKTNLDQPDDLY